MFGSAQEVWARAAEFDLAVVTTPTALHTEHALAALDAGLHVVVDKPIATTSADARRLVEQAEKAGRSLSTYQSRRWDAEVRTARTLVDAGVLGEVVSLELAFQRDVGPLRPGWRDTVEPSVGGGVTFDLGSHLVDAAQYLLGPAESVTGSVRAVRGGPADDDMDARLVHAGGATSRIVCSWVRERAGPGCGSPGRRPTTPSGTRTRRKRRSSTENGRGPRTSGGSHGRSGDGSLRWTAPPTGRRRRTATTRPSTGVSPSTSPRAARCP